MLVNLTNNFKKIFAFTLAEVLITLGIIGVVAAMTIPTLMNSTQNKETVTGLKKVYSVLSQAYTMAELENGTPDSWGLTADPSPEMLNKLKPYLRVTKDCTDGSKGCFPTGVNYKLLDVGNDGIYDDSSYAKLRLADGTLIIEFVDDVTCNQVVGSSIALQHVCGSYSVDINGDKKPNQRGKDTFLFYLTNSGIVPMGSQQETLRSFDVRCKDKATMDGAGCAAWVIYNENLDYLKCNTLSWSGPTKCN